MIWSPRSNLSLYGNTAPVTMLKNQGVLLSLGTDWTPSGSANLLRELNCADRLNHLYYDDAFTDRELWLMATRNPAVALGVSDKLGARILTARSLRPTRAALSSSCAVRLCPSRSSVAPFMSGALPSTETPRSCPRCLLPFTT